MNETETHSAPFAAARCPSCGFQRPVYDRLAEDGTLQQACLACDAPVIATDFLTLDELEGLGYGAVEEPKAERSCGCAGGGCPVKSKPN